MNNDAILKTIYSPSPSGYVEPKTAAFTGFTSSGGDATSYNQYNVNGNFDKGWNFYTSGWKTGGTLLFPAVGYRETWGNATGNLGYLGEECLCLTAGASSTSSGIMLFFRLGRIFPNGDDPRSRSTLDWPVKE